ncbi:MAG: SAM-dependent chlorinase/fluorinase [Candidatus Edwardsbacteria bacterium]
MSGIITLTTDFGLSDSYVGAMKGVILSINPEAKTIDVCHLISSQDIFGAAFILNSFYHYFPKGTIHLLVVDPEVGGKRRPILVETKDYYFIGPDNGVFSYIYEKENLGEVIHLTASQYFLPVISDTFHGRDIFAPIGAHLSLGVEPRWFGQAISDFVRFETPKTKLVDNFLEGCIIHIDRFGNLITNIAKDTFEEFVKGKRFIIEIKGNTVDRVSKGYSEISKGTLLVTFGSEQLLEVAISRGRASEALNSGRGEPIRVKLV